jgi:chitin disaccharide deacetylase
VRQGGRQAPLAQRLATPKALVLDVLSAQFRKRAARAGIPFNPAFAGAYDFSTAPDFGALMRQFVDRLPEGGLVMCHPGFVDDTLLSLDPLTTQREAEHAFLASDDFPALLQANNVTLA